MAGESSVSGEAGADDLTHTLAMWSSSGRMNDLESLMWRGERHPDFSSTGIVLELLDSQPDWDRLRAAFRWAAAVVPRLRQRVVDPLLPTGPPAWVEDDQFDLEYHLRRVSLPPPARFAELLEFAQITGSTPFDRTRPLWTCSLALLADGGAGLVFQAHHCLMDGASMIELLRHMHSDRPAPTTDKPEPESARADALDPFTLSLRDLVGDLRSLPNGVRRLAGLGSRLATDPGTALGFAGSLRRVLSPPPGALPSPLMAAQTGRVWRFGTIECSLDQLKAAGRSVGGSVNDAYMSALLGGIRSYHDALGVQIGTIPMAMPISLRRPGDPTGGNQFAAALLPGPAGIDDPGERIAAVRGAVVSARAEPALDALGHIAPLLTRLPRAVMAGASRAVPRVDLSGSNVPGMARPVYAAGAKIERIYVFGPLPGVGMMSTLISYAGTCFVGINVDGEVYRDTERLWVAMRAGFDEVLALAPDPTERRRST